MPTFDFSNIIRSAVRAVLSVLASPVAIMLVIAAFIGTLAGIYFPFFSDFTLPDISGNFSISIDDSAWLQFVAYILDFESFAKIVNFGKDLLYGVLTTTVTFFTSFFVGIWAYKVAMAIRTSIKDLA